jgi:hypothetical protein
VHDLAVDPRPDEALLLRSASKVDVLALAAADDRASTWKRVPSGSQDAIDDLLRGLAFDRGCRQVGQCGTPARAYSRRR